jgi:methionine aminotransferase
MRAGHNQYPPMPACRPCARPSPQRSKRCYGHQLRRRAEITITAGATQAILTAILAIVHPGDEVIVLDPCYDSYVPNIELAGGTRARAADARQLPARLRQASPPRITPRTRAIIINSPHNPSATVWSAQDMQRLEELLRPPTCC